MRFGFRLFLTAAVLAFAVPAHAACTNPAGNEGVSMYNVTYKTMQFCDGTNWIAMGGNGTVIPADTILESMLKSVNAPTDEYCLTYESTTGDFEWQTCGAGGDNLGNHTATTNINLGANYISRAGTAAGLSLDASNNATFSGDLRITGDDLIMTTNTAGMLLIADGTNFNPTAVSGDITITGAGVTAVGADKVTEAMLKAVNAATDEYCLTYETTTGDFEWQTCGAGGDNLGNHTATTNINLGANYISRAGTAAGISLDASNNATISGDLTISGDDLFMATNTAGRVLIADGTNFNPTAVSGDITVTGAGVTAIGADKVTEAMLKAVNAATDEYCLTYETTTGDFEWQTCGAGGDNLGNHTATANVILGSNYLSGDGGNEGIKVFSNGTAEVRNPAGYGWLGIYGTGSDPYSGIGLQHGGSSKAWAMNHEADGDLVFVYTANGSTWTNPFAVKADGSIVTWNNSGAGWLSIGGTGNGNDYAGVGFYASGAPTLWTQLFDQTTGDLEFFYTPDGSTWISPLRLRDSGNVEFKAGAYLNFGATDGTTGYGFRDNSGTVEYKNSGGSWAAFGSGGGPTVYNAGSSTTINWNNGAAQYTTANCGAFTLSNMADGGNYTLVVKGATSGTCSFTHSGLLFSLPPSHTSTIASTHTLYAFVRMGSSVYVSWIRGMPVPN